MKLSPFPPELRTMAFVPRWGILMSIRPENVAAHSFYVTYYTRAIADIIEWKGPLDYAMWKALIHDADETITADIAGPSKKHIIDEEKAQEFIDVHMNQKMPGMLDMDDRMVTTDEEHDEALRIVHCADKLDALLYLIGEYRMGNRVVEYCIKGGEAALEGAWRNLPGDECKLSMLWQTTIIPAIKEHYTKGGMGV